MDDYDFIMLDYDQKLERFNRFLEIIYANKVLLKNEKFKRQLLIN